MDESIVLLVGGTAPKEKESKMPTTQELVSNLMMKYAEFYARALEMGFESDTSHFIAARLIEEGLNGKVAA